MKTIVVYKTKYGSSKQYAQWIADALKCKAERLENIRLDTLSSYDMVVYVGSLYAGRVLGFKKVAKYLDVLQKTKLLLCMVGMTNPLEQDKYQNVFLYNVPEQFRDKVKYFALRGDQLFSKMSFIHRLMMNMPKSMTEKIPVEQRTEDDIYFLEHFGEDVHYVNKESIYQIVAYVNEQARTK